VPALIYSLSDTMPAPVSLVDALAMREEKEKELFDDDPAMSTMTTPSARPSVKTGSKVQSQQNRNWVMINGQSHKNGSSNSSASTSKRARRTDRDDDNYGHRASPGAPDPNRLWAEGSAARNATGHQQNGRSSAAPPPKQNGHHAPSSRSGTNTPKADSPEHTSPRTYPAPQPRPSPLGPPAEEPWTGPYPGPVSGFLTGPGAPFGRAAQNPGRTIYSQQHRTGS
jgi:hypothetical protein